MHLLTNPMYGSRARGLYPIGYACSHPLQGVRASPSTLQPLKALGHGPGLLNDSDLSLTSTHRVNAQAVLSYRTGSGS